VESLVSAVEDVNDREPTVLVDLRKLELFAVVPRVGSGSHFFDVFDRDCGYPLAFFIPATEGGGIEGKKERKKGTH
jgi:hypothetical protein